MDITYKLKKPYKFGEQTVTEYKIKKPKAKDIRNITFVEGQTGPLLTLLANLSGESDSSVDELEMEDVVELVKIVGNFMAPSPTGGKKP